jgi:hypothetical protein
MSCIVQFGFVIPEQGTLSCLAGKRRPSVRINSIAPQQAAAACIT